MVLAERGLNSSVVLADVERHDSVIVVLEVFRLALPVLLAFDICSLVIVARAFLSLKRDDPKRWTLSPVLGSLVFAILQASLVASQTFGTASPSEWRMCNWIFRSATTSYVLTNWFG